MPSSPDLGLALERLAWGKQLAPSEHCCLESGELADFRRAQAFGITTGNLRALLQERSRLFQAVYPVLCQSRPNLFGPGTPLPLHSLWSVWLPLARQIALEQQRRNRPLVQGILGVQGTGKTTLSQVLVLILGCLGFRALSLSLDDLYKTYAERKALQAHDPRLVWRGPPGTHDIALGIQVLDQLRQSSPGQQIVIPRFKKSAQGGAGDRAEPEFVQDIDIVLFEGWMVGVRPIESTHFAQAPPPIVSEADRCFARDMNAKLRDYLPLWERLDRLLILHPVDYRLSQQWRRQAEQQRVATAGTGMGDAEIDRFVEYFWRSLHPELFIRPLTQTRGKADLVIEVRPDHAPGAVYCPGEGQTRSGPA